MVQFFERRTRDHIDRVAKNLVALAGHYEQHRVALLRRARTHDASKFGPVERGPYIWLTEYHRCRRTGVAFDYPDGVEGEVRAAIDHHVTHNRHHAEYHSTPDSMTEVDLIEMVCDWTAMAQEYGEHGGSARPWAEQTVGTRVQFSEDKVRFIYDTIEALDEANRSPG